MHEPGVAVPSRGGLSTVLEPGGLTALYQPVVRLDYLAVVGYEALARMPGTGHGPDRWLDDASRWGRRTELELACLRAAATAGPPPDGRLLFVNVSPATLCAPESTALIGLLPERLVLEITEDQPVEDRDALFAALATWCARGARLAVDDTGSGYASLEQVVALRPDYLKLSSRLVQGLDQDRSRLALVRAVSAFAREVGASVVAEGVERPAELSVLQDAGVDLVQGHLLARPGPPWPAVAMQAHGRVRRAVAVPGLAEAPDATAAAEAVVSHLVRVGPLMPSVYIERGGRLRCIAQRGYWQIYDGMRPYSGIIGRTHLTGEPTYCLDVAGEAGYLEAAPGLRTEICLPLRVEGQVVGVLNVESPETVGALHVAEIERAAQALTDRIAAVGVPRQSAAQRLGSYAVRLAATAGAGDLPGVVALVLAAAADVSGLASGVLLATRSTPPRVLGAAGPQGPSLASLGDDGVAAVLEWTSHGTSCYTQGTLHGVGLVGHEPLRDAGIRTFVVLPVGLAAGAEDREQPVAVLLCGSEDVRRLSTEDVELLELLCAHVASCLSTVDAVTALRHRASTDPLTGLGHSGAFRAALDRVLVGRHVPAGTAVLYVDIDDFKGINDARGHAGGDEVLVAVAAAVGAALRDDDQLFRLGGDEFAVLLRVRDADELEEVGQRLRRVVRERCPVSVSVGGAVATTAECPEELVHRSDLALYAVKRQGRDGVLLSR